jgi:hypothetical protein
MASLWFLNIARFAASGNRPLFKIKGNSNSLNAFSLLFIMLLFYIHKILTDEFSRKASLFQSLLIVMV